MASTSTAPPIKRAWWKESSVYQIYPASFKDSNGDGIGDIPGIISELDYIKNLGVDIVWLSPILQSPQVDMGYDISNYYEIHPPYGTLRDVDALIEGLHARGLKYVMDLVTNHTSDQHEWFKQAISSPQNPYRNWYIWKKPKYDADGTPQPPNNWRSHFGGSAWTLDPQSNEYYLHLYAKEQPDLNWDNPDVRAEVHRIVRHWLDKGVDGFRIDVINFISKDPAFPDAPITDPSQKWQDGSKYYACGPKLHDYLRELGSILKEYDAFSVGEMPCVSDPAEILKAVGFDRGELSMVFHFEIMDIDHPPNADKYLPYPFTLPTLKRLVSKWQTFMHDNSGWNALYIENHDQGRSISRLTLPHNNTTTPRTITPHHRTLAGQMLATFLALQSGTPFIYQGQELGMINVSPHWTIHDFRDIEILNHWQELCERYPNDNNVVQERALREYRLKSRDNARTPMQWDASEPWAGFIMPATAATNESGGGVKPWIGIHEDYKEWNAARQVGDEKSVYGYWKRVLGVRKAWGDIFVYGDYGLVDGGDERVFVYKREIRGGDGDGQGVRGGIAVVVLNFWEGEVEWVVPGDEDDNGMGEAVRRVLEGGKVVLGNYEGQRIETGKGKVVLRPLEAFVVVLAEGE
ncbi:hypothetical protein AJ79_07879 [Helicocarpus griseus UAMH5409]|uniref:Glycosyl hydrolase family 13 catalytic domain-containing protein n=1 Tax=Helicocarpus griseus UAMH5409 TaxID=1447875 RepID=A0A2B7WYM5_9EURO|nr:hypothetical protein AJ79_07879 [Helicocarpus griseus UAMH5409]